MCPCFSVVFCGYLVSIYGILSYLYFSICLQVPVSVYLLACLCAVDVLFTFTILPFLSSSLFSLSSLLSRIFPFFIFSAPYLSFPLPISSFLSLSFLSFLLNFFSVSFFSSSPYLSFPFPISSFFSLSTFSLSFLSFLLFSLSFFVFLFLSLPFFSLSLLSSPYLSFPLFSSLLFPILPFLIPPFPLSSLRYSVSPTNLSIFPFPLTDLHFFHSPFCSLSFPSLTPLFPLL